MVSKLKEKKETVDDYMQVNVITIEVTDIVKNAVKKMDDHKLHKIIVMKNKKPKFIIKKWDVLGVDSDVVITEIEDQLEQVQVIASGTVLTRVYTNLENKSALVISRNDEMVGVITSSDLLNEKRS